MCLGLAAVAAAIGSFVSGSAGSGGFYVLASLVLCVRGLREFVRGRSYEQNYRNQLRLQAVGLVMVAIVFLALAVGAATGVITFTRDPLGRVGYAVALVVAAGAAANAARIGLRLSSGINLDESEAREPD